MARLLPFRSEPTPTARIRPRSSIRTITRRLKRASMAPTSMAPRTSLPSAEAWERTRCSKSATAAPNATWPWLWRRLKPRPGRSAARPWS